MGSAVRIGNPREAIEGGRSGDSSVSVIGVPGMSG
jgi:hypothetical protein